MKTQRNLMIERFFQFKCGSGFERCVGDFLTNVDRFLSLLRSAIPESSLDEPFSFLIEPGIYRGKIVCEVSFSSKRVEGSQSLPINR